MCSLSVPAAARVDKKVTYKESIVWRCAVRFVRVDLRYKIVEKDKDTGYLLFEYLDGEKIYNGSIEILPVVQNNQKFVRVQVRIENQPSYVESLLYNKLARKLKSEYGAPPAPETVRIPKPAGEKNNSDETGGSMDGEELDGEEDLEVTEDDLEDSVEE